MSAKEMVSLSVESAFVLDRTDKFWKVDAGEVDVFYVSIGVDGEYLSQLTHLYRACAGELIFSLLYHQADPQVKLICVSADAGLMEFDYHEFYGFDFADFQSRLETWIASLSVALFNSKNLPRIYKPLTENAGCLLNINDVAYPAKGIVWCRITEGAITRYGGLFWEPNNVQQAIVFPVSNILWVQSLKNGSEVDVLESIHELQHQNHIVFTLNELQSVFYSRIIENYLAQTEEEELRIRKKITADQNNLNSRLYELVDVADDHFVEEKDTGGAGKEQQGHILLSTCQLIGDEAGFKFVSPKLMEAYSSGYNKQLFAIAQASALRVRKVILRGNWWKEENGHLLGFFGEDKHPVAMIQKKQNQYQLVDLLSQTSQLIDADVASQLDPAAYMFFFSFDTKMDSLSKIWQFAIHGVKKDAKFLILAALSGSVIGLLVPVLSGRMFDDVIPTADRSMLFEVFAILLIIGITSTLLQLVQAALQLRVETKSNVNLQGGLMDHLMRLPVSFFRRYTAGDLTNRVLSVNAIRQILSNTVMTTVLGGAFSIVNLVLLFYYDSSLALLGLGLVLFAVTFITVVGWQKLKFDRKISNQQGDLQGFLFEFISGITKIRIAGAEKRIFSLWAGYFARLRRFGFKSGTFQNYIHVFNESFPLLTNILFFAFIYYMISSTDQTKVVMISIGSFMAFITAFNQFLNDSLRMSMSIISSLNVVTLYERVKPILEETPESTENYADPGELSGDIELNSISFRYDAASPLVLNNLSLKIKAGEMVAFVGPSGSGKSTIMRILLGFEVPESGSVYYDGSPFDSMNKDLLRQQIGVVLQNGTLMSGSIYQNIVGNSELTLEDAWVAARMAGMEEDIQSMPMEMHTVVSEGAGTFSGGQRQRLMIARAIAHKPRLLYMDEATSALDNRTQNIVAESLDNLQATRIVIAHRISTIVNADRIFVLDKGIIVESGTYRELMQNEGLFAALAKRQMV